MEKEVAHDRQALRRAQQAHSQKKSETKQHSSFLSAGHFANPLLIRRANTPYLSRHEKGRTEMSIDV
jgi:hypothetical protein